MRCNSSGLWVGVPSGVPSGVGRAAVLSPQQPTRARVGYCCQQFDSVAPKPMADPEHLKLLQQGVAVWNAWRAEKPTIRPDLTGAFLKGENLNKANLRQANLVGAKLINTGLLGADLSEADLSGADLAATLIDAGVTETGLAEANLTRTNFTGADLIGANLSKALLVETNFADATLTGCRVYGIAAWGLELEGAIQNNLIITGRGEPALTVDNIEVAQLIYLLLHNEKTRAVIDTVGKKGVLLLGRFTDGRIAVLERLREELRKQDYVPIVFNFEPKTKTFTETIRVLAGLSRFVIADVTDPQSVPAELQAVVPTVMVPFLPIIEKGKKPYALLEDLRIQHGDRMLKPFSYPSLEALAAALEVKIIKPAETRFAKLQARKRRR
jgi:hypothetical protein